MAAVGKFIHNSAHTGLTIGLTNAYVAGAQRHVIPLWQDSPGVVGNKRAVARLSALWIKVDTIAGASAITMRLTRDLAGNDPVIGDTTATLSTGITTPAEGGVTYKIDIDYSHDADANLYCHMKTNAGTCNVKRIELFWEE